MEVGLVVGVDQDQEEEEGQLLLVVESFHQPS